jgi:NADPH-dependent curcumin reductase CurA
VTTKNFYAAFDPSQRGRMRDPKIWSYSPAMEVGKPVLSVSVIGKVLKSDNSNFKEGSIIMLPYGTESYSAIPESALKSAELLHPPKGLPLTAYLGALGMTGMTAYGSLMEIGQPKKGETIWVSGAAGAVGQM